MEKQDTENVIASKYATCIMKINKKLYCNGIMAENQPEKIRWK